MADDIEDRQIEALKLEAAVASDLETAQACTRALAGDDEARRECAAVIASALAMAD